MRTDLLPPTEPGPGPEEFRRLALRATHGAMSEELRGGLDRVARRVRRVRLWGGLAACWLAWSAVGAGLAAWLSGRGEGGWIPGSFLPAWGAVVATTGGLCAAAALRSARDRRLAAHRVEERYPGLAASLLAAVEEDAASAPGSLGFLQSAVIRQALEHRRSHDWGDAVPAWRLRAATLAHAASLVLLLASTLALAGLARSRSLGNPPPGPGSVRVEPGDTSVERGTPLLVVARFEGSAPADAVLVVEGGKSPAARLPMTRGLEDPTFAGRVESVESDLSYRVEYRGGPSPTFRARVFEYPEMTRTDAALVFPAYTALAPKTVEDVRHVTAVEGTELTLTVRLNKEVAGARLVDEAGHEVVLTPRAGSGREYRAALTLAQTRRYRVRLVDREGRGNRRPADLVVNVTPNRPPAVAVTQPSRDVRVSPVEELTLKSRAEDDYGVVRHGLSYALADSPPREVVLAEGGKPARRVEAQHLADFEALKAEPDQLLTYFAWAEDVGPDGKTRRAEGDLFFAEVRHLEEVFRQGEQSPAGSEDESQAEPGEGEESTRLAELQKEIVNGTWALVRRETGSALSDKFAADVTTLRDSQRAALGQASALGQTLRDRAAKASLGSAVKSMTEAEARLAEAARPSVPPLKPALAAARAAYQALLKLRAREFEVSRSRRSRGGRAGGGPSQRQLDQLELAPDDDRYEQRRAARDRNEADTKREREQRENRQLASRLRDLARRQADLNRRLKELQAALEAARTAEARAEAERQLKRLREQQQEVLRDTDEVRERTEREENRDRLADARKGVEEGREHVRKAGEALDQGRLSQAANEGARAGRQFEDLREQLRKAASDKFTEAMAGLRADARDLEEKQERLSRQLGGPDAAAGKSLRETGGRAGARQDLDRQAKDLDALLNRMRTTVEDAEETEPLLARQLFDTFRRASERSIPDALKEAARLAEAGVPAEAARSSRRAAEGLGELREGVERAAKSVLGDETAALRRARGELDDLAEPIRREIARAGGRDPENPARPRPGERTGRERQAERQGQGEDGRQGEPGPQDGRGGPGQGKEQGQGQVAKKAGRPARALGLRGGPPRPGEGEGPGEPRGPGGAGGGDPRGGDPNGGLGPITGEGFREWFDRMREVEELLDDPELRAEAARVRDRVRGAREDYRRHSKPPDPKALQELVAEPIRELRERVAEEVRRRESPDALVPIDRDPVPPQFAEGVRRYYERLGGGR